MNGMSSAMRDALPTAPGFGTVTSMPVEVGRRFFLRGIVR